MTHTNGTGINDTTIQVSFTSGFTSSNITVQAVNECGTSSARSLSVVRSNPSTPGLIGGPVNVCSNISPNGVAAVYSITDVNNALSYNWTVPAGAINLSGQGTNTISFVYPPGFTNGSLTVSATNGCGTGSVRSLAVTRLNPATPGVIDVIQQQSCPDRIYSYTIASMPANATTVQWTIPSLPGVLLISGQGTTSILVSYPTTSIMGNVTATAQNNCGTSVIRQSAVRLPACPPPGFAGENDSKVKTALPPLNELILQVAPNPTTNEFVFTILTTAEQKITG